MKWVSTTCGCVNERFIIRVERDANGSILHLTTGEKVRSSRLFHVIDGELKVMDLDDDDSDDCPF